MKNIFTHFVFALFFISNISSGISQMINEERDSYKYGGITLSQGYIDDEERIILPKINATYLPHSQLPHDLFIEVEKIFNHNYVNKNNNTTALLKRIESEDFHRSKFNYGEDSQKNPPGKNMDSSPDFVNPEWVAHYASNAVPSYEESYAIARDPRDGSIYISGIGRSLLSDYDYLTIKYDSNGVEKWIRRYAGPGEKFDKATAIAIDPWGNVYVTGESSYDIAIVKYNAQGDELWVRRYAVRSDPWYNSYIRGIAVDSTGNVFLIGECYSSNTSYNFLTLKYSPTGELKWERSYSGQGYSWDWIRAITVDIIGNIYITGCSIDTGGSYDYITIKYSNSGDQIWLARYNGPANSYDYSRAIAVDNLGNVYVSGSSVGLGSDYDYALVKYNSNGEELWVSRYNGTNNSTDFARGIALDTLGNVYITGRSAIADKSYDYATVKYNSSGIEQWVRRYNGTGNGNDLAYAISVDLFGNVYVTGYSIGISTSSDYATIKYDSSGIEQWVRRYNGSGNSWDFANAMTIDATGNLFIAGTSVGLETYYDCATIKYSPNGNEQWISRYHGSWFSYDRASNILLDSLGNIYITGTSHNANGSDFATIKYNPSGVEQWVRRYNGPGDYTDNVSGFAIDRSGNVYVTGISYGSSKDFDYATIKYDANGQEKWVARYSSTQSSSDYAIGIAVDNIGNVYVTGSSFLESYPSYVTVKYDSNGVEQWATGYEGGIDTWNWPTAINLDNLGNSYVTGYSEYYTTYSNCLTIKYNSNGTEQWVSKYGGIENTFYYATGITTDNSGNVYVTGYGRDSSSNNDYITIRYNSNGEKQWDTKYNGPGNSDDRAVGITIDDFRNVYVTGHSEGNSTDYATIMYDSSGVEHWASRYKGQGGADYATAISVDGVGNIYVTGYSYGSDTYLDYATIKYNSSGNEQWVVRYNGPENDQDVATAISVDRSGNVYVTGTSSWNGGSYYTTIKYKATQVGVKDQNDRKPISFKLEQNYPNPFNPFSIIHYELPVRSQVLLKVYNLLGQEVATLVNEEQPAGYYDKQFDAQGLPSGIYIYRIITSSGFNETRKMLLLR